MAQLTVVDDAAQEIAVLVDTDTFTALPLVAVGPDRVPLLQGFADSVPFDLTILSPETLRVGFTSFLSESNALPDAPAVPDTPVEVGSQDGNGNDADARQAEAEAVAATDTPDEQPADTDEDASPPTKTVTVDCFNCNGRGTIEFGDGQPSVRCNVCKGTGVREEAVPA